MDISKAAAAYQQAKNIGGDPVKSADTVSLGGEGAGGPSFADLVSEGMENARSAGYTSEAISTEALANKAELHDLVTAVSNAELTLNTVVAVRDRMVNAYQDIIKMPI